MSELRLYEILKQRGQTVTDLAYRLGVTPASINHNGKYSPSVNKLQEYADALGVPVWELLVDCGEQMPVAPASIADVPVKCDRCGAMLSASVNIEVKLEA